MKTVILFFALLFPFSFLHAEGDSTTVEQAFIHTQGKTNLYVLQLKQNSRFDYMRYDKKHTYHDWGIYKITHGKISFTSQNRKHGFNSVGGKTYFYSDRGLYKTRWDKIRHKKSVLDFSDDAQYHYDWSFNPLAGRSLEVDKTAPKPLTVEQIKALKADHAKKYYMNLVQTYANPYKGILDEAYCGPDCYRSLVDEQYVDWNLDTTASVLFSDFETVIHESTHHYERGGTHSYRYMIEPGINIDVDQTTLFPSSEIKVILPSDAKTRIFRYDPYITDSSIVSSNVDGFYGLLNEFTAYNSGCRAATLAAQTALQKGDTATASKFINQAASTYFAYYEFKLFMGAYLHDAKLHHADDYKAMVANTNLRVAYTLLDDEFTATVDNFKRTSDIIQKSTGADSYAFNDKTYAAYPKQLLTKEKTYLDAFRVKGVTNANYFTFVN
ncbi:MAG TPA: hypothetical protein VL651_06730 [Bacteroidia bacterium]|jgi:hypothetical protein|nr:hypothetical protein [Bacteroidia bacterium]